MGQRLIDARFAQHIANTELPHDDAGTVQWVLSHTPTVDAVTVVRCKDCIRRYDTDECPMCFLIEGKYYEYTNENGFCDRGERKEGAE